jgi:seryl-tRNA synthetase
MLDVNLFREKPDVVKKDLKKRGQSTDFVDRIIELDEDWRKNLKQADAMRHKKNVASEQIGKLKKAGKDAAKQIQEMRALDKQMQDLEQKEKKLKQERDALLMRAPNILHESVPVGQDDSDNVEVKTWGKPVKKDVVNHGELIEEMGLASFEQAAKTTGSGFVFLKGDLALLDQALMRFSIDYLLKQGFTLVEPPLMLSREAYEGVTDLGDFESVMYKIEGEDNYLIATSEHPMGAMHMNEVLSEDALPLKYCGVSACFRKEIGRHGVDTRGLFRMHQFNKIEQFVFCKPEDSWKMHEELIGHAEELHKKLEVPYRVVNVCTGDIGTVAAKKYDLEAWSPRQEKYVEVVSCSNCTDYQARRLNVKYGKYGGDKELVHTLNSTAIATSRTMLAILENHQTPEKTVKVPKALQPYMNGVKEIGVKK